MKEVITCSSCGSSEFSKVYELHKSGKYPEQINFLNCTNCGERAPFDRTSGHLWFTSDSANVTENLTFSGCILALLEGKRVRRATWVEESYLQLTHRGLWDNYGNWMQFFRDDLEADDWMIIL